MMFNEQAGSIICGIIGDAIGSHFEFGESRVGFDEVHPSDIPPLVNPQSGATNVFGHPAGSFTDDSIQMILFMEMILEFGGRHSTHEFKRKLLEWIDDGRWTPKNHCFDVGVQTIMELRYGPSVPADQNQQGNGGIMRAAPIAWFFQGQDREIIRYNRVTHPAVVCNFCALMMSKTITGEYTIDECVDIIERLCSRLDGTYRPGSAWVVSTLLQALYIVREHEDNFQAGLAAICNDGGDTDTIACVYGQIWGSRYGLTGIHPSLYENIWEIEKIKEILVEFTNTL